MKKMKEILNFKKDYIIWKTSKNASGWNFLPVIQIAKLLRVCQKNLDVEGFMEISLKYFSKAYDKIFIQSSQIATCMTL